MMWNAHHGRDILQEELHSSFPRGKRKRETDKGEENQQQKRNVRSRITKATGHVIMETPIRGFHNKEEDRIVGDIGYVKTEDTLAIDHVRKEPGVVNGNVAKQEDVLFDGKAVTQRWEPPVVGGLRKEDRPGSGVGQRKESALSGGTSEKMEDVVTTAGVTSVEGGQDMGNAGRSPDVRGHRHAEWKGDGLSNIEKAGWSCSEGKDGNAKKEDVLVNSAAIRCEHTANNVHVMRKDASLRNRGGVKEEDVMNHVGDQREKRGLRAEKATKNEDVLNEHGSVSMGGGKGVKHKSQAEHGRGNSDNAKKEEDIIAAIPGPGCDNKNAKEEQHSTPIPSSQIDTMSFPMPTPSPAMKGRCFESPQVNETPLPAPAEENDGNSSEEVVFVSEKRAKTLSERAKKRREKKKKKKRNNGTDANKTGDLLTNANSGPSQSGNENTLSDKPAERRSERLQRNSNAVSSESQGTSGENAEVKQSEAEKMALIAEYGLHVVEHNARTKKIEWVVCKFCPIYGPQTRRRDYIKAYKAPFNRNELESHLMKDHKRYWMMFRDGTEEVKRGVFYRKRMPLEHVLQRRVAELKRNWGLQHEISEEQRSAWRNQYLIRSRWLKSSKRRIKVPAWKLAQKLGVEVNNTQQSKRKQNGKIATQQKDVATSSRKSDGIQERQKSPARPELSHMQEVRAEVKELAIEMNDQGASVESMPLAALKAANDRKARCERRSKKLNS